MATAEKLTYLNATKGLIKDAINNAGANITNDTFRSYATTLGTRITKMRIDYETALSYLPMDTKTNTSVSITDAVDLPTYSFKLTKESTQSGTPTPESPIDVNVVEGYRNLFDKDNVVYVNGKILNDSGSEINDTNGGYTKMYMEVKANEYVTISGLPSVGTKRIYFFDSSKTFISRTEGFLLVTSITTQTPANCKYIDIQYNQTGNDFATYMVNEGNTVLPYVPYGTNWIYTTITDGTSIKNIPLPLNNNEIAGIGDYKDQYIVDKYGHCYLNKKMGKVVLDGSESVNAVPTNTTGVYRFYITISDYIIKNTGAYSTLGLLCDKLVEITRDQTYSRIQGICYVGSTESNKLCVYIDETKEMTSTQFKSWLESNNLTTYLILETPQLIDLNYTVDMTLYEGTNTITNSETAPMEITYVEDINTILATLTTPSVSE